jgi:hypothetical protein
MDLMETFKILRKYRLLTSALLLLTLLGTVGAAVKLPWTYQSVAQTVLLNSNTASKATGGNPYLAFDPSLAQTANVLVLELMDPRTAQSLAAQGASTGYTVAVNSAAGGPVIQITATGSNPTAVESTLNAVTKEVNTKLVALQSGIERQNRITSSVISLQPVAKRSTSKKAKPLAGLFGVGLVFTFLIPQIVNGVAVRRRRRRSDQDLGKRSAQPGDLAENSAAEQRGHVPVAGDASPPRGQWPDRSEDLSRDSYEGGPDRVSQDGADRTHRRHPASRSRR